MRGVRGIAHEHERHRLAATSIRCTQLPQTMRGN
jgi:hypothetical protein